MRDIYKLTFREFNDPSGYVYEYIGTSSNLCHLHIHLFRDLYNKWGDDKTKGVYRLHRLSDPCGEVEMDGREVPWWMDGKLADDQFEQKK